MSDAGKTLSHPRSELKNNKTFRFITQFKDCKHLVCHRIFPTLPLASGFICKPPIQYSLNPINDIDSHTCQKRRLKQFIKGSPVR